MTISSEANRLFDYDPETGVVKHRITHGRAKAGKIAGTERTDGYRVVWFNGKLHLLHRIIYLLMNGEWPPQQIDHINRNRTDNRWCNLRAVTPRENIMNRGTNRMRPDNTSGYVGVSFVRQCRKWKATISYDGRRQYLGLFATPDEAAAARENARVQVAGGTE